MGWIARQKIRVERTLVRMGKIHHVLRIYSREITIESEEKAGLARIRYQNDGKEAKLKVKVSRNSEGLHRNRDF